MLCNNIYCFLYLFSLLGFQLYKIQLYKKGGIGLFFNYSMTTNFFLFIYLSKPPCIVTSCVLVIFINYALYPCTIPTPYNLGIINFILFIILNKWLVWHFWLKKYFYIYHCHLCFIFYNFREKDLPVGKVRRGRGRKSFSYQTIDLS